ncbi:MAG: glycosyltransferase [Acidobacteria bacterium]|nr:glycosyltransferase [Acidobacteriota bacterium]
MSNVPLTLSLVIPSYNQRARTRHAAAAAIEFLQARFLDRAELIVVDDGSLPGQAVEPGDLPPNVTLIRHQRNLGKGGAVRSGVIQARGSYIVFTDSDLPFSLEPLAITLEWLRGSADIVIGERRHPQSPAAIRVTWARHLSSAAYTWVVRHLLDIHYPDIQCGYKGYRAAVAKALFGRLEVTSFSFEAEIMIRAKKAGYQIRRLPVLLVHNEDSSVRLTRHAPRMLLDTLRIAWRARRGAYD